MIGTDSHKRPHTVVVLDDVGRHFAKRAVQATGEGHLGLVAGAGQLPEACFALEDCRHLTRRLEQDPPAAGRRVVRVPTRLMAGARRAGRQPGRSDPIDAEAVALAALRHPDLPVAMLAPPGSSSCHRTTGVSWCASHPRLRRLVQPPATPLMATITA